MSENRRPNTPHRTAQAEAWEALTLFDRQPQRRPSAVPQAARCKPPVARAQQPGED